MIRQFTNKMASISMKILRLHGALNENLCTHKNIKFYDLFDGLVLNVDIEVSFIKPLLYGRTIEFKYDFNGNNFDYDINMLTKKCNYGGFRYYFNCFNCSKLTLNLYLSIYNGFFVCKKCSGGEYKSRTICYNKNLKSNMSRVFYLNEKLEGINIDRVKKTYKGKITKKYKKIIEMENISINLDPLMRNIYNNIKFD